jgi:hypothetical protein
MFCTWAFTHTVLRSRRMSSLADGLSAGALTTAAGAAGVTGAAEAVPPSTGREIVETARPTIAALRMKFGNIAMLVRARSEPAMTPNPGLVTRSGGRCPSPG